LCKGLFHAVQQGFGIVKVIVAKADSHAGEPGIRGMRYNVSSIASNRIIVFSNRMFLHLPVSPFFQMEYHAFFK